MSCCAVGCLNRKSQNRKLKFYRIPSTHTAFSANRRRLWLTAIRRADWSEDKIKNARLCSAHFISGEASMDYNSPDFAPSVFSYRTQSEINKGDAKLKRFKRKRKRDETTRKPPDLKPSKEVTDEGAAGSSGACLSTDACRMEPGFGLCTEDSVTIREIYTQGDIHHLEHDYCSVPEPKTADNALDPAKDLREEVERLRRQVEEMSVSQRFCLGRFAASDDDIRFYTRFTTFSHLMAFWKLIEPASYNMIRVSRVRAAAVKREDGTTDALDRSLQPIDEFFLFMVHLSVGLTLRDLGHRFNIHEPTVSRIITTWANFLYTVLRSLRIWMSTEAIKAHLPNQFQDYPDTQVLIHCVELRCQTPSLKSEDFSSYKSHNSLKGLIGMAPHGAVTFVSSLYAASVSDKELFKQSGIVSLLKPEMAIMVTNRLFVDDCVPCKVYRPAYLLGEQISADEERETRLRVHIEGLIHRIKQHKLLDTVIPLSVTRSINQIYTVACFLVNYQNGPLVEGWAED